MKNHITGINFVLCGIDHKTSFCSPLLFLALLIIYSDKSHSPFANSLSKAEGCGAHWKQLLKYIPPTPSSSLAVAQKTVVAAPCC